MSVYARIKASLTRYEIILVVLFVVSVPFANPWVRGDGVGYYAYIQSLLIHGNLNFEDAWKKANTSFVMNRLDATGNVKPDQYNSTGHLRNSFTVGPAILWAPFLIVVHGVVLGVDGLGAHIAADGFSLPYTATMAFATCFYGFLALILAFRLACRYFEERWAFWGTLGIWFASSLPVYMYFNPSWSHAHSAFAVTAFLWYWHRTRQARTWAQWFILAFLSGLMLDVYYPNIVFLLVPLLESLSRYWEAFKRSPPDWAKLRYLFFANVLYASVVVFAFLPTLITRKLIFGNPLTFGYGSLRDWSWKSPVLLDVLFSSNHGLLVWTPIIVPAVIGLFKLYRRDGQFATLLGVSFLGFYYLISSYPWWDGMSSFGNRFFISLTPVFVLGLAATLESSANALKNRAIVSALPAFVIVAIAWNLAFVFQWGTKMIPNRGPISWREMARNQAIVPFKVLSTSKRYLWGRKALMDTLEREDVRQIMAKQPPKEPQ